MTDTKNTTYQIQAERLSFLRKVPLFNPLTNEDLERVSQVLKSLKVLRGEVICIEGEPGDALYIIRAGIVTVSIKQDGGKKIINHLHQGDFFGEMSLLTGEPRAATVTALLDTDLLVLSKDDFAEIIKTSPLVSVHLNRILSRRLKQSISATQQEFTICFYSVIGAQKGLGSSMLLRDIAGVLASEIKKRVLIISLDEGGIQTKASDFSSTPVPDSQLLEDIASPYKEILSNCWFQNSSGATILAFPSLANKRLLAAIRANLPSLLGILRMRFDHVFFDLAPTLDPLSKRILRLSEKVLLLTANTLEGINLAKEKLAQIKAAIGESPSAVWVGVSHLIGHTGLHRSRIKDILGLPEVPEVWVARQDEKVRDAKPTFARKMSRARRVAREIGSFRVGLALGAGGARGWAHIGVLEALEKENVTIDMITGTSIGALVGAIYAKTISAKETYRLTVGKFPDRKTARKKIFDYTVPLKGFIKGTKILRMVEDAVQNADFLDLGIPLAVVAVDILTGGPVVLNSGPVAEAVRCSIAIPGVMEPVRIKDKWLVDGGLVNPLPADILIRKGIDFIIAVFLENKASKIEWDANRGPNIINILTKSFGIISTQASQGVEDLINVAIHPKVEDFRWDDFHRGEDLVRLGREATYEVMDRIKQLFH